MPKPATLTPYNQSEIDQMRERLSVLDSVAALARERKEPRSTMLKRFELSNVQPFTRTVVMLVDLVPIVDAPVDAPKEN